jgi:hypothetical protein
MTAMLAICTVYLTRWAIHRSSMLSTKGTGS